MPFDHTDNGIESNAVLINGSMPAFALDASSSVSFHERHRVNVSADSYSTIFSSQKPTTLLGGSMYGVVIGGRLTIDGTVVFDRSTFTGGSTSDGAELSIFTVPPAQAESSMTLEVYNPGGDDRIYGWRVMTQ